MSTHPYTTTAHTARRYPLATTAAPNVKPVQQVRQHIPGTPPPKPQDPQQQQKQPSSPPLPRQNAKVPPPSPPRVITDKTRTHEFVRVGLLGEGGFARVYEVEDRRKTRYACKVVTKESLKTKKAKTKLYAEIKIHKALKHPNIVRFLDCFEDDDNVYMTLELCHNGSLMDMLRRRRRFTEPESRYYMVQLLGACHYMHNHQVIHRDLKLGNIFLDSNMNVKVGDFGLAALIESPGERKKTICGTPNYIAPEVLFDTANGHSFEVDTWSIGVILYTLVIGRPPFQTKDVKAIYKRIRDNDYEFPPDRFVSLQVQELVREILTPDPQERPTLHEILDHEWFTRGIVPACIPISAHDSVPDFRHITRTISQQNLMILRKHALLDNDVTSIAVPSVSDSKLRTATSDLARQEKEFQKAVQPGSPISALLSSARQPLLVGPTTARGEQPLFRKLQAAKEAQTRSPGRGLREARGALHGIQEEREDAGTKAEELRKKELESQKARIVAQMVPAQVPTPTFGYEDVENVPPQQLRGALEKPREKAREAPVKVESPTLPSSVSTSKVNSFDAAAQVLTAAFEAKAMGRLFRDPAQDMELPNPKLFIASWVDYCNKYGMGYALTDGTVGVHFNDTTTLVLSPDKVHFDYISSRRSGSVYVRKNYTISEYPEELKSKVYLLKHFEKYIMDKLYGDHDYIFEDRERTHGMAFVQKYLRMKQIIIFKLSNDVIQFNFYDHSKVMLSSHGLVVTHIDKNYQLTRQPLSEIMALSLRPPMNAEAAKRNERLVEKLRYAKEVLVTIIRNAPQSSPVEPETAQMPPAAGLQAVNSRPSKASLR